MMAKKLKNSYVKLLDDIVDAYRQEQHNFELIAEQICSSVLKNPKLRQLVHSVKYRTKDPDHLRDKLERYYQKAVTDGKSFNITPENVFEHVTDLAGVRILHLHLSQFPQIDSILRDILVDLNYLVCEGPIANTWDDEYRQKFSEWGALPMARESMYTSVHYVIDPQRKKPKRCELQVRTLMEEVWGEVSHTVNYPHETTNVIVKEQLKVLARFTSGCTRLVDTIFHEDV